MHAIGFGGERHIDTIIDDKGMPNGTSARLIALAASTIARVSLTLSRN